jgi:methylmalonyl-CoA mutase
VTVEHGLELASGFPTPTREQWLALVDKVLAGADFDKKLVTTTPDGIRIQPLYTEGPRPGAPGFDPYTRGRTVSPRPQGAWDVRVSVDDAELAVANRTALDELAVGATSLRLVLGPDGVSVSSADELDALLEGVYLDLLPVELAAGAEAASAAGWLREVWSRRGVGGAEVSGNLGFDPIGLLASDGEAGSLTDLVAAARTCADQTPRVAAAMIDLGPYVEAGATPAQQLGVLLATGIAYLRALDDGGVPLESANRQLHATVVLDADLFGGIALCRAARRLWSALLGECDVPEDQRGLHLLARSAERMLSRRDPWVNMLRVTSACFAAAVGGVEGFQAVPFDAALGVPNTLGRRIARNTQLILQEESNIGRVLDPAGGSYYLETLTEELAGRAWEFFTDIERRGGIRGVLEDGSLRADLDASWEQRRAGIATRRIPLTGVSEFPLLEEDPVERPPRPSRARGGLPARRDAAEVEALRDASDAHLARTGARPRIFLANLGTIAQHTARATWAKNFFEAGGVETIPGAGTDDPEELAREFAASGATVACLCGSDDSYRSLAAAASEALRAAGAARVYLAGRPLEGLDLAAVDRYVGVGSDLVAELRSLHELLGVSG